MKKTDKTVNKAKKPETGHKSFTLRVPQEMWKELRRLAYLHEVSINEATRMGINLLMEKTKNTLKKNDTMV